MSNTLITGPRSAAPRGRRVPANDIEMLVRISIKDFLASGQQILDALSGTDFQNVDKRQLLSRAADLARDWEQNKPAVKRQRIVRRIVHRVVIQLEHVDIEINRYQVFNLLMRPEQPATTRCADGEPGQDGFVLKVDAVLKRAGQGMRLVIRDAAAPSPNTTLINLFVKAFDVREKIFNGTGESIEASARRININANYITSLLRISTGSSRRTSLRLFRRSPSTHTDCEKFYHEDAHLAARVVLRDVTWLPIASSMRISRPRRARATALQI
ncbi:MAG: hypothetical protein IPL91_13800 [Hyphomicrobium sp.]|nr:hypothetical protein [Hyphomicrobium sp.]